MTANVITYRDRSAAREVGKALGYSPEQVDRLASSSARWNFGEIREPIEELAREIARRGLRPARSGARGTSAPLARRSRTCRATSASTRAAWSSPRGRLDEVVPLEPASMPGRVVVQWDKDDCADLGIIKVDLLGLGMLAALEEAIPMIRDAREGRGRPRAPAAGRPRRSTGC